MTNRTSNLLVFMLVAFWTTAIAVWAQRQPQQQLQPGADWGLLEFDNGSQWYIRGNAVTAIHAIPEPDSKRLGYKTIIIGNGFRITCPMTAMEIDKRIIGDAKIVLVHPTE